MIAAIEEGEYLKPLSKQGARQEKSSSGFESVGSILNRMASNLLERGDMLKEAP